MGIRGRASIGPRLGRSPGEPLNLGALAWIIAVATLVAGLIRQALNQMALNQKLARLNAELEQTNAALNESVAASRTMRQEMARQKMLAENLLAVADAPPTIDAALVAAYNSAAIYFPFTDVMVADPYADIAKGLRVAFYIGQSTVIGGVTTDIVAYALDNVFVQIWIGADDKLPRMARAVYRNDRAQLRHQMEISDWKLDVAVPADAFATAKADKAMRIKFDHPNRPVAVGTKPPAKPAPAKAQ